MFLSKTMEFFTAGVLEALGKTLVFMTAYGFLGPRIFRNLRGLGRGCALLLMVFVLWALMWSISWGAVMLLMVFMVACAVYFAENSVPGAKGTGKAASGMVVEGAGLGTGHGQEGSLEDILGGNLSPREQLLGEIPSPGGGHARTRGTPPWLEHLSAYKGAKILSCILMVTLFLGLFFDLFPYIDMFNIPPMQLSPLSTPYALTFSPRIFLAGTLMACFGKFPFMGRKKGSGGQGSILDPAIPSSPAASATSVFWRVLPWCLGFFLAFGLSTETLLWDLPQKIDRYFSTTLSHFSMFLTSLLVFFLLILAWTLSQGMILWVEEVFFRGFLQGQLGKKLQEKWMGTGAEKYLSSYSDVLASALIYGLYYALKDGGMQGILALGMGGFYGYAYHKTQRLWVPMTLHFLVKGVHVIFFTYPAAISL